MIAPGRSTGIPAGRGVAAISEARPMRRVPAVAAWLGWLGAIPFVALATFGQFLEPGRQARASFALAAYGAVILSFLGGIRSGLAIAPADAAPDGRLGRQLLASVVPPLAGWIALLLPALPGLALLAAGFALMLVLDVSARAKAAAPSWYPPFRLPLSGVVA